MSARLPGTTDTTHSQTDPNVDQLERAIDYRFQDKSLARTALTHSSIASARGTSNERLEFLGDRVLGLIVAEMLYDQFPNEPEGALGYRFPALVRAEALARVADRLNFAEFLLIDDRAFGENKRRKTSVLSNACEAVIAALYVDGGLVTASSFVKTHWQDMLEEDLVPPKDPKTQLQELVQANGSAVPAYQVTHRTGPDHAPVFTVEVTVEGVSPVAGSGPSKRAAETAAAAILFDQLLDTGQS